MTNRQKNSDPSVKFPDIDRRAEILPYPNKGRFFPADWVYVVLQKPDGTVTRHGRYMVEMVTAGKYTLCSEDGIPIAIGERKFFEDSELQAAS